MSREPQSALQSGLIATLSITFAIGLAAPCKATPPGTKLEGAAIPAAKAAKHGDNNDVANPGNWIRRAQEASVEMDEQIADEKLVFLGFVSRAMAQNCQGKDARTLAGTFDPLTRINTLLSIAGIQAEAGNAPEVRDTLKLMHRELASLRRDDPTTFGAEAAGWLRTMVGIHCTLGNITDAKKAANEITPELDQGSLQFTNAGPVETPSGAIRSEALADIAANQARLGDAAGAKDTVQSIPFKEVHHAMLWLIGNVLASEGHVETAQTLVKELRTSGPKDDRATIISGGQPIKLSLSALASNTLAALSKAQAAKGDFAAAKATMESISLEEARLGAMQEVAGAMIRAGKLTEAIESARGFTSRWARERVLLEVGLEQAKQGDLDGAKKTADENTAKELSAIIYCRIAQELFEAGKDADAADLLRKSEQLVEEREPVIQGSTLCRIGKTYCRAGQMEPGRSAFKRALRQVDKFEEESARQQVCLRIAGAQFECGEFEGGKQVLAKVEDRALRIRSLISLAGHQHEAGQLKEARQTFHDALNAALQIEALMWVRDPRSKAGALLALGNTMAKRGELELVSQFADEAGKSHSRAPAYLMLGAAEGIIEGRETKDPTQDRKQHRSKQ